MTSKDQVPDKALSFNATINWLANSQSNGLASDPKEKASDSKGKDLNAVSKLP